MICEFSDRISGGIFIFSWGKAHGWGVEKDLFANEAEREKECVCVCALERERERERKGERGCKVEVSWNIVGFERLADVAKDEILLAIGMFFGERVPGCCVAGKYIERFKDSAT